MVHMMVVVSCGGLLMVIHSFTLVQASAAQVGFLSLHGSALAGCADHRTEAGIELKRLRERHQI